MDQVHRFRSGRFIKLTDVVVRTQTFPASQTQMWEVLTDPSSLSQWFGMECVELDLRPGGRFVFRRADGRTRPALVEEVDSPNRLVFRWLPFEVRPDGTTDPWPGSTVEMTLVEIGGATELTVLESPAHGSGSATVEPLLIEPIPIRTHPSLVFKA